LHLHKITYNPSLKLRRSTADCNTDAY